MPTIRYLLLIVVVSVLGTRISAQEAGQMGIWIIWNDTGLVQPLAGNDLLQVPARTAKAQESAPTSGINSYAFEHSPLTEPPTDGYGFYQGVWSADRTRFACLVIAPDSPDYRVTVVEDGQQHVLFSGQIEPDRGYLVPVGWAADGNLILLERYSLHNLREARLWQVDSASGELTVRAAIPIPDLKGNSATLTDEWVFLGFDTVGLQGYLFNINTGKLSTFPTTFALQDPPASVFEHYPVDVLGVVDIPAFEDWLEEVSTAETDSPPAATNTAYPAFLHWPLPDYARSVTCYTDSDWTAANFDVECPGLAVPRAYQGHEGTDIGGKPAGLPVGTAVYAAAPGLVVDTFSDCGSDDITCGDSYGNHLLLEHTQVRNHNAETWFTGYAHLKTVLVEPYTYIDEIGMPIALSGDTGFGGAHLHFEVRAVEHARTTHWIDPWDDRPISKLGSLWIGGNAYPIAAVIAYPPPTQWVCQTIDGNNIRSGPGIAYDVVAKSTAQTDYEVFQVQHVEIDQAPGDWYHIRWPDSDITGWMWSDLMNDCIPANETRD